MRSSFHPPATPSSGRAWGTQGSMLAWLKQLRNRRQTARSLYGSIVTQARSAGFYARWGVPDTLEGRFEMIALHLVLVLRRLAEEGEPGHRLARELTEAFAVDDVAVLLCCTALSPSPRWLVTLDRSGTASAGWKATVYRFVATEAGVEYTFAAG